MMVLLTTQRGSEREEEDQRQLDGRKVHFASHKLVLLLFKGDSMTLVSGACELRFAANVVVVGVSSDPPSAAIF